MSKELHRKYRPRTLAQVVGQERAVAILTDKLLHDTVPHAIMFSGPTGTGKTTLAHILRRELGCTDYNLVEINCADVRGIDSVREIQQVVPMLPLGGGPRVWILDEVVQLPKTTQQAFLKVLEDVPEHVYFFLCTSETTGLLPTFKDRCFQITTQAIDENTIAWLVCKVALDEEATVSEDAVRQITLYSDGSARKALQMLEACLTTDSKEEQAGRLSEVMAGEKGDFLARVLFQNKSWAEVKKSLQGVEDRDAETLRRQVLAYASAVMLNPKASSGTGRAYQIIMAFQDPFTWSGKAGLLAACWQCCLSGSRKE
jgi:DNA polymerase III subunit gamma/tau